MKRSLGLLALAGFGMCLGSAVLADDGSGEQEHAGGRSGDDVSPPTAAHDVGVKLESVRMPSRPGRRMSVRVVITNSGGSTERGVVAALYAGDAAGLPIWTKSVSVRRGRSVSKTASFHLPDGVTSLTATAALRSGAADEVPGDNSCSLNLTPAPGPGPGPGPAPAPVPAPSAAQAGEATYAANCSSCHGAQGRGGTAPSVVRRSASDIYEAMREGEDGMPRFLSLTRADATALAAYLKDPSAVVPLPPAPTPDPTRTATWDGGVGALFTADCAACHRAAVATAGVALDTYAAATTNASRALAAIEAGRMPPAGPMPAADVRLIQDWVAAGMPR